MLIKDKVKYKISQSLTWFLVFTVLVFVVKLPAIYVPLIFLLDIVITIFLYTILVAVEK